MITLMPIEQVDFEIFQHEVAAYAYDKIKKG